MRKIIFIDHSYHAKTGSSAFFQDMLARRFRVEPLLIDPDLCDPDTVRAAVAGVMEDDAIIYLWQLDFLAPLFLAMGLPVVCSPMYDGSGGLPPAHWDMLADVHYINFSVMLHERTRAAGSTSLYVKYFPDLLPPDVQPPPDFSGGLRGFFWRRRPEHGLDLGVIHRIFGSQLTSLHIHDAPDTPAGAAIAEPLVDAPYPITRSHWFADPAGFREVLAGCNFYIAPRLTEGIGMGYLEAMAAGMLVAAHDAPTHHEYIANGVNGLLFHMGSQDVGRIAHPERMGRRARETVALGRQHWLDLQDDISAFLEGVAAPARPRMPFTPALAQKMVSAYRQGHADYLAALAGLRAPQTSAAGTAAASAEKPPRVLLAAGFHTVEVPSERFFPVRVVWASGQTFTLVPLDAGVDLQLIFRDGRGKGIRTAEEAGLAVWRGGAPVPFTFTPLEQPMFFRLTIAAKDIKPFEGLEIRTTWPLFEIAKNDPAKHRWQGLLLFEAGVELMQL